MDHNKTPRYSANQSLDNAVQRAKALLKAGYTYTQAVGQAARDHALEFGALQREMTRRSAEHRATMAKARK